MKIHHFLIRLTGIKLALCVIVTRGKQNKVQISGTKQTKAGMPSYMERPNRQRKSPICSKSDIQNPLSEDSVASTWGYRVLTAREESMVSTAHKFLSVLAQKWYTSLLLTFHCLELSTVSCTWKRTWKVRLKTETFLFS